MLFLNLGCGNCFIPGWTNVDFISNSPYVKQYDLRKSFPFKDNYFDFVYHSHVLEHFSVQEAQIFMKECHRVLRPGGTVRVVVPDLEQIAKEYLVNLERLASGETTDDSNYEWMMLELYDQVLRDKSGGEMQAFISKPTLNNETYIYTRLGDEARQLRQKSISNPPLTTSKKATVRSRLSFFLRNSIPQTRKKLAFKIARFILNDSEFEKAYRLGKFRLGGEIHQWMYDVYSLKKILLNSGFNNVVRQNAHQSYMDNWPAYPLDLLPEGSIRKPDSLFMEGKK